MQGSCILSPFCQKQKTAVFHWSLLCPLSSSGRSPIIQTPSPAPAKASPTKVGNLDLAWDLKILIFRFVSFTQKNDVVYGLLNCFVEAAWSWSSFFSGAPETPSFPPGWANSRWQKALVQFPPPTKCSFAESYIDGIWLFHAIPCSFAHH